MSVVLGLVVSVTLVPALLAVFGRAVFWPRGVRGRQPARAGGAAGRPPAAGPAATPRPPRPLRDASRRRARVVVICIAAPAAAASGLRLTQLGLDFVTGLPAGAEAKPAARSRLGASPRASSRRRRSSCSAPGIARSPGAHEPGAGIAAQPGVAGVLGPREQQALPGVRFAVVPGGNAVAIWSSLGIGPLGSSGIATYDPLSARCRGAAQAGLGGALGAVRRRHGAGRHTVQRTLGDLARIAIAVASSTSC